MRSHRLDSFNSPRFSQPKRFTLTTLDNPSNYYSTPYPLQVRYAGINESSQFGGWCSTFWKASTGMGASLTQSIRAGIVGNPTVENIGYYFLSIALESLSRKAFDALFSYLYSLISTSVSFDSRDESFRWMIDWIRDHPSMAAVKDFHVCSSYGLYGLSVPADKVFILTSSKPFPFF